jgi:hypothetical protein
MKRLATIASISISFATLGISGCGGNDNATGGSASTTNVGGSGGQTGNGGSDASGGNGGSTGAAGGIPGDKLGPWEGGDSYYKKWSNGPPADPSFFPISVWLQDPSEASAYAAIGVNQFIGLWEGPTEQQVSDLGAAKMPVLCDQNVTALGDKSNKTLRGWTQEDEPDDAQSDGHGGYGPCITPASIQTLYQKWTAADATRPVFLNLGQGVAYTDWGGRGTCTSQTSDYPKYSEGADILSFDIYPMNETDPPVAGDLTYVAKGVDNLRGWAKYQKPGVELDRVHRDQRRRPQADARRRARRSVALDHPRLDGHRLLRALVRRTRRRSRSARRTGDENRRRRDQQPNHRARSGLEHAADHQRRHRHLDGERRRNRHALETPRRQNLRLRRRRQKRGHHREIFARATPERQDRYGARRIAEHSDQGRRVPRRLRRVGRPPLRDRLAINPSSPARSARRA